MDELFSNPLPLLTRRYPVKENVFDSDDPLSHKLQTSKSVARLRKTGAETVPLGALFGCPGFGPLGVLFWYPTDRGVLFSQKAPL